MGHEVRRRYSQGLVCERGAVWRHDDVPWHRGADDEGAHGSGSVDDEDQGYRAAGAQVLCVDRRVDLVVAVDVPADVDLEAGVRRERADDRPPQVLLSLLNLAGRRVTCTLTKVVGDLTEYMTKILAASWIVACVQRLASARLLPCSDGIDMDEDPSCLLDRSVRTALGFRAFITMLRRN